LDALESYRKSGEGLFAAQATPPQLVEEVFEENDVAPRLLLVGPLDRYERKDALSV